MCICNRPTHTHTPSDRMPTYPTYPTLYYMIRYNKIDSIYAFPSVGHQRAWVYHLGHFTSAGTHTEHTSTHTQHTPVTEIELVFRSCLRLMEDRYWNEACLMAGIFFHPESVGSTYRSTHNGRASCASWSFDFRANQWNTTWALNKKVNSVQWETTCHPNVLDLLAVFIVGEIRSNRLKF